MNDQEVQRRYDHARSLLHAGDLERAAVGYTWVWAHSKHPSSLSAVRASFMVSDISGLIRSHPVARGHYEQLREDIARQVSEPSVGREEFDEWVLLNRVLGEEGRTLEWFDRVKGDEAWRGALLRLRRSLERILADANRWADLGQMIRDPAAVVRSTFEMFRDALAAARPQPKKVEESIPPMLRQHAGRLYAASLAAGREDSASAIVAIANEFDGSTETTVQLIETALSAGEPRQEHIAWLDRAWPQPDWAQQLRERVQAALDERK